jgi:hypothetical protein
LKDLNLRQILETKCTFIFVFELDFEDDTKLGVFARVVLNMARRNTLQQSTRNAPEEAAIGRIVEEIHHEGNAGTRQTYEGPQREFLEWCSGQSYPTLTRTTVTAEKLLLFLSSQVHGRESRKKSSVNRVNGITQLVGHKTMLNYVSAIVRLWREQQDQGVNTHPNPRNGLVKDYLRHLRSSEHSRIRTNHVDRMVGTVVDGYSTTEQLSRLVNAFLHVDHSWGLRDRLYLLLCHHGLLRGQSARQLELADMFTLEIGNEGPTPCTALVLLMLNGKTNTFGKREYAAMYRSSEPTSVRAWGDGALPLLSISPS